MTAMSFISDNDSSGDVTKSIQLVTGPPRRVLPRESVRDSSGSVVQAPGTAATR
jgi:hypothetical protein